MKRNSLLTTLAACTLLLASCHTRRSDMMGDWVTTDTPAAHGFTLGNSGIAASIGNPDTQYLSWNIKGERLYLHGKHYLQGTAYSFIDTLVVTSFTPTTMTVWVKDKKIKYVRP